MTSHKGKEIIASGWRASGISDALKLWKAGIPSIDPFHDLYPVMSSRASSTRNTSSLQHPGRRESSGFFRGLQQKT